MSKSGHNIDFSIPPSAGTLRPHSCTSRRGVSAIHGYSSSRRIEYHGMNCFAAEAPRDGETSWALHGSSVHLGARARGFPSSKPGGLDALGTQLGGREGGEEGGEGGDGGGGTSPWLCCSSQVKVAMISEATSNSASNRLGEARRVYRGRKGRSRTRRSFWKMMMILVVATDIVTNKRQKLFI